MTNLSVMMLRVCHRWCPFVPTNLSLLAPRYPKTPLRDFIFLHGFCLFPKYGPIHYQHQCADRDT